MLLAVRMNRWRSWWGSTAETLASSTAPCSSCLTENRLIRVQRPRLWNWSRTTASMLSTVSVASKCLIVPHRWTFCHRYNATFCLIVYSQCTAFSTPEQKYVFSTCLNCSKLVSICLWWARSTVLGLQPVPTYYAAIHVSNKISHCQCQKCDI